ncbi:MAG: metallophosphoesterase [Desulfobacterales bacterium]|nr:metallophosphoesterase [Desulfobacterales bacterium]
MIHLMTGCSSHNGFMFQTDPDARDLSRLKHGYPDVGFLVCSDPHYYDQGLGVTGRAFQNYLDRDRKLLVLSREIIGTAVGDMAGEEVDFVLVCGDMTKDGEMVCHRGMVDQLEVLKDSGKKVYVVPGNHDVQNYDAVRFVEEGTESVLHAGPHDFVKLYWEFGYGESLAMDPHSLSYVVEPVDGLWLLALDSCQWQKNRPGHHPIIGGAHSRESLPWIEARLIEAKQRQKAVMVFQHHGAMAHYPANEKFYGEYLVKNHGELSALLANYQVDLVFTGHFHAQDVTSKTLGDHTLFDIETGSLVTAPCPWRRVDIKGNRARIQSRFVRSIPSMGKDFAEYADTYVFEGTRKLANAALDGYMVSPAQQELINHQIAKAYLGHLKGDETVSKVILDTEGFNVWLRFIAWMQKDLIKGWQTDLSPRDNDLTIDLMTGRVGGL